MIFVYLFRNLRASAVKTWNNKETEEGRLIDLYITLCCTIYSISTVRKVEKNCIRISLSDISRTTRKEQA